MEALGKSPGLTARQFKQGHPESRPNAAETSAAAQFPLQQHIHAVQKLVAVVQELSLARSLEGIVEIVRSAARELTGADGATFVLRDQDQCFYVDEDAIAPLWKGMRFPMSACISGWVMLNRQPTVIEDIYIDARIPADAYRPTFVKSLAMVPIRTRDPVGAIGNYWAKPHRAAPHEVELLEALANTTAVAMENVRVYAELEKRVQERTRQLEAANHELESFSYSVSHDLQAPVRRIAGFSQLLTEVLDGKLSDEAAIYLQRILSETRHMGDLIEDLLRLARLSRVEMRFQKVNLSLLAGEVAAKLQSGATKCFWNFEIQEGLEARGDPGLLRIVLENLLSNACKYSSKREHPLIAFGSVKGADGPTEYFVRDNGAGFDVKRATRLFAPFQRFHQESDFPGSGVGLATVQRIINRHGGRIRAESEINKGATFYFTLE